jgi:tetratricopeptide (TPR) repeat protein
MRLFNPIGGTIAALICVAQLTAVAQESTTPAQRASENLDLVQQAYAERQGPQAASWRSRIRSQEQDLERSLDWLIQNNQGQDALRFVDSMNFFLIEFGESQKSRQRFAQVLDMPSASATTALRAKVLYDAGVLAFRQGDEDASKAFNEQSLDIGRKLNDKPSIATALIGLSRIALRKHDYATVRRDAEEALRIRQEAGDSTGEMSSVHMLAAATRMEGDSASASKFYELTLGIYGKNGDKSGVAGELMNLAFVHLHEHDPEWAARLFKESVLIYRDLQSQEGLAWNISGFAAVCAEKHEAARAARLYGALDTAMSKLGIILDPDDALDLERYSKMAQEQLGRNDFDAARTEGRQLSVDEALVFAQSDQSWTFGKSLQSQ